MNDDNAANEIQDFQTLSEDITSGTTAVIQVIQDYNMNYINGTLGIVGCLGFVFGALLGTVYERIFRK